MLWVMCNEVSLVRIHPSHTATIEKVSVKIIGQSKDTARAHKIETLR